MIKFNFYVLKLFHLFIFSIMPTISKLYRRWRKEQYSIRFIISWTLFRLGISIPLSLTFDKATNTLIRFGTSSASHKIFRKKFNPVINKAVFRRFAKPGATVFDVGANIGMYTLLSAHLMGEKGGVFAFEPTHSSFRELLVNIKLNSVSRVVMPILTAISDENKIAHFIDHTYSKEQNRLASDNDHTDNNIPVLTIRLDTFMQTVAVDHIDLLKIDVEGAELKVLRSLGERIADVSAIYFECREDTYRRFDYDTKEVINYLERKGFSVFLPFLNSDNELQLKELRDVHTISGDLLALREEDQKK